MFRFIMLIEAPLSHIHISPEEYDFLECLPFLWLKDATG